MGFFQEMYSNTKSRVRVGDGSSDEFEVKVGVHQGLVLSPLLFTVLLEALSQDVRAAVSWEELYTDESRNAWIDFKTKESQESMQARKRS